MVGHTMTIDSVTGVNSCPFCGGVHSRTVLCSTVPDETADGLGNEETADERLRSFFKDDQDEFHRQIRIEALRAAAAVVPRAFHSRTEATIEATAGLTLTLAEQFAKWLEDGK